MVLCSPSRTMRTSLIRLSEAAANASKPARQANKIAPGTYRNDRYDRNDNKQYILVDTPRTALATDVQRALKEVEAVSSGYPLSAITPRPIGAKRTPSLITTYHLAFNSPSQAQQAAQVLRQRPLFAASTRGRNNSDLPDRVERADPFAPRVALSHVPALEWAERTLARSAREGERPLAQLPGEAKTLNHVGGAWALDKASRNRRVMITGLPVRTIEAQVRRLASGVAEIENIAIRQLPHTPWSNTSSWAITATSVAQAHQLARKLNQNYFAERRLGYKFLIRAHVQP